MHRTAKYFITFTLKCFALAVAAVSAEVRAILLNKSCKSLQFLCRFVNSEYDGQFCTQWPILCKVLRKQNSDIPSLDPHFTALVDMLMKNVCLCFHHISCRFNLVYFCQQCKVHLSQFRCTVGYSMCIVCVLCVSQKQMHIDVVCKA